MSRIAHTKMGEDGRVAIPAEMCREYGLEPGSTIVLEASASGIVLRSLDAMITDLQAAFAAVAPPNVLLSEELLQERREEAAQDERETQAWLREFGSNRG